MNREEAITALGDRNNLLWGMSKEEQEYYSKALDMAISALSAEPTCMIEKSNFSQEQYKADLQCAYDCGKASVSAEGEYIKKEDTIEYLNDLFGEMYHVSFGNVLQSIDSLPTYSFPDREKGVPEFLSKYEGEWVSADKEKQLYSDLLRVKHGTMNIDSLIDKVYADMRKEK